MRHRAQKLASRILLIVERSHLIKFLLVGGASFAVDLALLTLLHEVFGVGLWIATPIAFIASLVFNFALQRSFTFRARNRSHVSLLKYLALVVFNIVAIDVIVNVFDAWGISYGIGKAFATVLTTAWNFWLYKVWIFRHEPEKDAEHAEPVTAEGKE
ncbi:GtrA family protein [Arthrobacter liuii]|uniref:GtrA family protein n=1 Tax=Arthrobacter liuii TaxID=1476996 RepID=UPI00366F532B